MKGRKGRKKRKEERNELINEWKEGRTRLEVKTVNTERMNGRKEINI